MGKASHTSPGGFASTLNSFVSYLVAQEGGDRSGRWLEERTNGARKKDYWKKFLDDVAAMTTNDIEVLADAWGVEPYDFVEAAMKHAADGAPIVSLAERRVRTTTEDELAAVARPTDPEPTDEQ